MPDIPQTIPDRLRRIVSTLFGVPADDLVPPEVPTGQMITWPVAGEPGVGEWFTVVVYLQQDGTVAVEHCFCSEGISRDDDVREFGPFELADPASVGQIEDVLREITRRPTF